MPNHIILIGPSFSGKSASGRIAAKKIGIEFIDVDDYLVEKKGKKVKEIIKKQGWEQFRRLEQKALFEILKKYEDKDIILGTGGGLLAHSFKDIKDTSIPRVHDFGKIILLLPSEDSEKNSKILHDRMIKETIKKKGKIELEDEQDFMNIISTNYEREPLYKRLADIVLYTENKTIEETADMVVENVT